jgi:hypothetical protein
MKITLKEFVDLNFELNGMTVTKENGEKEVITKGLFAQKASPKTKLYLQRLNKIVTEENELYNSELKKLYQKFGKEENGFITINPNVIEEFKKEQEILISAGKDIDLSSLWANDFTIDNLDSMVTEEHYPVLTKLLENNN